MRPSKETLIEIAVLLLLNIAVCLSFIWVKPRYEFDAPYFFWGLLLIPAMCVLYFFRTRRSQPVIQLSTLSANIQQTGASRLIGLVKRSNFPLRVLGLALLLFALARPQSKTSWQDVHTEGIDIVMALDISASMLAQDLKPDRLRSSKSVALDFINDRPNDRIGLVVYEGESFTQCPLTTDHRVLRDLFASVETGQVEGGTAIGMGLATAVNRLRDSEAKSKVVILLTDGVNNKGAIPPMTAAEIASEYGVRVYTIGVGTRGKAKSPVGMYPDGSYKFEYVEVKIDEETLQHIADLTGGQYYRATDEQKLREIYTEIDQLEKTLMQVTEHSKRNEEYLPFAVTACSLILLGFFLDHTVLTSVP